MFLKSVYGLTTQRMKFIKHYSTVLRNLPSGVMTVGSKKVEVEIIGDGNECIFFMPGGMGTLRIDFAPQLEYLDKKKFTIIGWSPPGCGLSPPSGKLYDPDTPKEHAELAASLLMKLGLRQLNIVGWCFGAITSIIMTANNPDLTKKLVLMSPWVRIQKVDVDLWRRFQDIDTWNPILLNKYVDDYGRETTQKMFIEWIEFGRAVDNKIINGDLAIEECKKIRCPTLVVHGRDDLFFSYKRHGEFVASLIKTSRLELIENGNHELHLSSPETFNPILEEFLLK